MAFALEKSNSVLELHALLLSVKPGRRLLLCQVFGESSSCGHTEFAIVVSMLAMTVQSGSAMPANSIFSLCSSLGSFGSAGYR